MELGTELRAGGTDLAGIFARLEARLGGECRSHVREILWDDQGRLAQVLES